MVTKEQKRPDRKRKTYRKPKDFKSPGIKMQTQTMKVRKTVRYLGVHFDKEMRVTSHCRYLQNKTVKVSQKLRKISKETWGLKYPARALLYKGVFCPVVTYAAAGWVARINSKDREVLLSAQRKALIALTTAYRTTSTEALNVIAGEPPIDLILEKKAAFYNAKHQGSILRIGKKEIVIRDETDVRNIRELIEREMMVQWQSRWYSSNKDEPLFNSLGTYGGG